MDRTDSGADTALKTRVHEFIYNFHQGSEYIQGVGWDGGSKAPRDEGKGIHTHLLQQSHVHTSSAHTHSSSATHTFASYAPAHTAALRDLGTRFTNWSWSVFYIQKRVLIRARNTQQAKIRLRWGCTNSGCSTALL